MKLFDEQVLAAPLRVDGVSELDPEGRIPIELLINGTTVIIPRWPRFPPPPLPGQPARFSTLYLFWFQNGVETEIFQKTYTYVDDQPEFFIPLTPQQMSVDGTAFIRYLLESFDGNTDPSPTKTLTIDHTVAPGLKSPNFLDANFWGYLNCDTNPPVWEKIRVEVLAETIFRDQDECSIEWQGFDSLNGSGTPLTQLFKLQKTLSSSDASNGFIYEIPFDPYVRPLFDKDSGVVRYRIFRNGIQIASSLDAMVKIDRVVAGEDIPCGGF